MAIWQYAFFVILTKSINDNSIKHFRQSLENNGIDDSVFWKRQNTNCDFFLEIEKILPRGKSWSEKLIVYGNVESNCFEILCEQGVIVSASFRIDFSSDYNQVLISILFAIKQNNCSLISEDHDFILPDYLKIKRIIEHSKQYSFYLKLLQEGRNG